MCGGISPPVIDHNCALSMSVAIQGIKNEIKKVNDKIDSKQCFVTIQHVMFWTLEM